MTVVVTISTADGVPASAPFKVSNKTAHDHATVDIAVSGTGPLRAYKLKRGGTAITNGVELGGFGAICGLAICGVAEPTAIPLPYTIHEDVSYGEFGGGADGAYGFNVYVYNGAVYE